MQVPLLRYRLPAMACTPPVLASLVRQSSSRGVLLTCHILVSPSMPGSLEAVSISMLLPAISEAPLKVCQDGRKPSFTVQTSDGHSVWISIILVLPQGG